MKELFEAAQKYTAELILKDRTPEGLPLTFNNLSLRADGNNLVLEGEISEAYAILLRKLFKSLKELAKPNNTHIKEK